MIHLAVPKWENDLLYRIARQYKSPLLNRFLISASDPYRWLPAILVIAMVLIYSDWRFGILSILVGALGASITDSINSRIIRKHTDRIRPGKLYKNMQNLGNMNKGERSFPSNHASNTMAFSLGLGLFFSWSIWFTIPLILVVGYSRIYCGAHYPLDVVVGWLHGSVWTILVYKLLLIFI